VAIDLDLHAQHLGGDARLIEGHLLWADHAVAVAVQDLEEGDGVGHELGVVELPIAIHVGHLEPAHHRIGRAHLGSERTTGGTDEDGPRIGKRAEHLHVLSPRGSWSDERQGQGGNE
jgi:hypothetical protein